MKIGIIGSAYPLRGGIATFNQRMAGVLQEEGHDVTIYSFSLQYPSILFPGKTQYSDEPAPAGLKIRSLINTVNPLNWIAAGRAIRKDAPDLLIVRFWTPFLGPSLGTLLRIVRKNRHTRIVAITDNVVPHESRAIDKQLTAYFFGAAHAFACMSSEVMRELRRFTRKPALQLTHPLYDNYGQAMPRDEALRSLKLDPKHRYILFFGFIRKYKGLDLLLEALADPAVAAAGIHLIVAGEYYGDRELYEGLIATLGLGDRVHLFTDFIPNDELRRYFGASDCVVLPYRSATQSGITQTAYQFGRGMVATRVGGLPEFVDDGVTGILCDPEPKAIAGALVRYFEPGIPGLAESLMAAKQQYSWPVFTEKLLSFADTLRP